LTDAQYLDHSVDGLIRPAGCALRQGTVNVSSIFANFLCPSDRVSNATT